MPRYTHPDALDNGPVYIKNNVTAVWLVPGYTTATSYATANQNKVASATMTSTDVVISASGSNRVVTFASKSTTASASSAAADHSVLYVSGTQILTAFEESSDQAITSGNPVTFPSATLTLTAPTA